MAITYNTLHLVKESDVDIPIDDTDTISSEQVEDPVKEDKQIAAEKKRVRNIIIVMIVVSISILGFTWWIVARQTKKRRLRNVA